MEGGMDYSKLFAESQDAAASSTNPSTTIAWRIRDVSRDELNNLGAVLVELLGLEVPIADNKHRRYDAASKQLANRGAWFLTSRKGNIQAYLSGAIVASGSSAAKAAEIENQLQTLFPDRWFRK